MATVRGSTNRVGEEDAEEAVREAAVVRHQEEDAVAKKHQSQRSSRSNEVSPGSSATT